MAKRIYDLEERLIEFSARVVEVVETLPDSRAGNYISGQLIRCGLAPPLLYAKLRQQNHLMTLFTK